VSARLLRCRQEGREPHAAGPRHSRACCALALRHPSADHGRGFAVLDPLDRRLCQGLYAIGAHHRTSVHHAHDFDHAPRSTDDDRSTLSFIRSPDHSITRSGRGSRTMNPIQSNPIQSVEYIKILPELVLTAVGLLVMLAES